MKKLAKILATVLTVALLVSCMSFAALADNAEKETSINVEDLLAFAQEHPLLAKIGVKLAVHMVDDVIEAGAEGAGEGIGDYFENMGETTGDRFDNLFDGFESGDVSFDEMLEGIGTITGDTVDQSTDYEAVIGAAVDGAVNGEFPNKLLGWIAPDVADSIVDKGTTALVGAFEGLLGSIK